MKHAVRVQKMLGILALSVVAAMGVQTLHASPGAAVPQPAAGVHVLADSGWGP